MFGAVEGGEDAGEGVVHTPPLPTSLYTYIYISNIEVVIGHAAQVSVRYFSQLRRDAMRCEAAKVVGRERIRNGLSTNSNSKRLRFIHKTKTTLKTYFLAY